MEKGRVRKGQVRLVEAILAVLILLAGMVLASNMTRPVRSIYLRETSDLRRLAYNLLNDFAIAQVYENIVVKGNFTGEDWESQMRLFISANLPPDVAFNLDVYELRMLEDCIVWMKLNRRPISNVEDFQNSRIVEAESVTYTYVIVGSPPGQVEAERARGTLLVLILRLGYGG